MTIRLISPRNTALNHTLEKSPMVTSPTTTPPGAMYTERPRLGFLASPRATSRTTFRALEDEACLWLTPPDFFTAANDAANLNFIQIEVTLEWSPNMQKPTPYRPTASRQPLPRSFKDLTPTTHFNPRTFFREMVWKALLTRRTGQHQRPAFPKLSYGQVAVTWIGHASFLVQ